MDITFLLWLQDFRNSTNDILTPMFELFSNFFLTFVLVIPLVIYWCINKRDGFYLLVTYGISKLMNRLLKLTFCVYRPWIKDPRIIPVEDAMKSAGGYSFPSGHTMTATPIYGGLAVLYGKKSSAITWLCAFLIFMTALSRNYLGVHTPQDVIVGIVFGLFSIYITSKVFEYVSKNPEKENLVLLIGLIICALSVIYLKLKSYPIDYDVNGKIIVNPEGNVASSFSEIGAMVGIIAGRYVDKIFIKFSVVKPNFKNIIFIVVGVAIFCVIDFYSGNFLKKFCGAELRRFARCFMMFFFAIAVWPFVLKKIN